jgi:hypothetical protein
MTLIWMCKTWRWHRLPFFRFWIFVSSCQCNVFFLRLFSILYLSTSPSFCMFLTPILLHHFSSLAHLSTHLFYLVFLISSSHNEQGRFDLFVIMSTFKLTCSHLHVRLFLPLTYKVHAMLCSFVPHQLACSTLTC